MLFLKKVKQFLFSYKTAPFLFLGILLITYLLLLKKWGFYYDDWPMIFTIKNHRSIINYYQFDRPFVVVTDLPLIYLLGTNPLSWHIACILLEWGCVLCLWWCLRSLWHNADEYIFMVTLLFTIYPIFNLQPIAVIFSRFYLWYALFFLSMALMILAIRKPKFFILFLGLSLVVSGFQILSVEYFWGLELMRPFVLWILFTRDITGVKERFRKTFLTWLPFLGVLLGAIVWRFFIVKFANDGGYFSSDPSTPILLLDFFRAPLKTMSTFGPQVLRDIYFILIGSWSRISDTKAIDLSSRTNLISWLFAIIVLIIVAFFSFMVFTKKPEHVKKTIKVENQGLILGLFALIIGMVPIWATNHTVVSSYIFAERYSLPAIFGASLIVAAIIQNFQSYKIKIISLAILIGLAAGFNYRSGNNFKADWTYQQRFYWQLFWRAPSLKPGTFLISENELFYYTPRYAIGSALNVIYPMSNNEGNLSYYFFNQKFLFDAYQYGIRDLSKNILLTETVRTLHFESSSLNGIGIFYQIGSERCLWILSSRDHDYPYFSQNQIDLTTVSNLDRINTETDMTSYPDKTIFGEEPKHDWCYYFEKADLARQMSDWETVSKLGMEAISLGLSPQDIYEWMPMIEGFIHTNNLDLGKTISEEVILKDPGLKKATCTVWNRALMDSTMPAEQSDEVQHLFSDLGCETN